MSGRKPRTAIVVAEQLYSIEEAAAVWSVSRDTIERRMKAGTLRFVTLEHRRRIPASALEEYSSTRSSTKEVDR